MRKTALATLGVILASTTLAGCGGGESSTTVPFKVTDTSNLDQMKESMTKNMKTKNYVDRTAK